MHVALQNYKVITLVILMGLITACSPLGPVKVPIHNYYTLNALNTQRLSARPTQKTMLISSTTAIPGYRSSQMIYTNTAYQIKRYTLNQWVASPATMLTPLTVQSIRNSGLFHAVIQPPFAGTTDYRLDTKLLRLRQVFKDNKSYVQLVLQVILVDNTHHHVIAQKRFISEVASPGNDPYSGVIAANKATKKVMVALAQFVKKSI